MPWWGKICSYGNARLLPHVTTGACQPKGPLWKLAKPLLGGCKLLPAFPHHHTCDVNPGLGRGSAASLCVLQAPENPRTASGNLFTFVCLLLPTAAAPAYIYLLSPVGQVSCLVLDSDILIVLLSKALHNTQWLLFLDAKKKKKKKGPCPSPHS